MEPFKITYTWTHSWTQPRWEADLILMALDLLEADVESSGNKDAVAMLESIGIRCK